MNNEPLITIEEMRIEIIRECVRFECSDEKKIILSSISLCRGEKELSGVASTLVLNRIVKIINNLRISSEKHLHGDGSIEEISDCICKNFKDAMGVVGFLTNLKPLDAYVQRVTPLCLKELLKSISCEECDDEEGPYG